jgi:hypothetical protein
MCSNCAGDYENPDATAHEPDGTSYAETSSYEGRVHNCSCGQRFVDKNDLEKHVEAAKKEISIGGVWSNKSHHTADMEEAVDRADQRLDQQKEDELLGEIRELAEGQREWQGQWKPSRRPWKRSLIGWGKANDAR